MFIISVFTMHAAIFFLVFGIVQSFRHRDVLDLYRYKYQGNGMFFGASYGGTCSYDPPSMPVAARYIDRTIAINARQFYRGFACGVCFRVTESGKGNGGAPVDRTFTVLVKDFCPNCMPGVPAIKDDVDGRLGMEMQAIQCPVGNSSLEYKFQGSSPYYIKLQVRNARIPATRVDLYQPKWRQWTPLAHTSDGFWTFGTDPVERPVVAPFRIRLTAANGQRIVDTVPELVNGVVLQGNGKQFEFDPNLPR
ncbi:uncharacterized protein LOC125650994 [Ostrea edulis]|uniref:uncharacterized protein LOC125650994 n=1 Tax=Ostrea edulis TaxID=37623 RepID=UPI002095A460|nr:uncharacterized protein LOC125650994 [Ostrea edulis]